MPRASPALRAPLSPPGGGLKRRGFSDTCREGRRPPYSKLAADACYWLPLPKESLPRAMSPVRRDMVRVHTNHISLQEERELVVTKTPPSKPALRAPPPPSALSSLKYSLLSQDRRHVQKSRLAAREYPVKGWMHLLLAGYPDSARFAVEVRRIDSEPYVPIPVH
jgi:hypothetical protein